MKRPGALPAVPGLLFLLLFFLIPVLLILGNAFLDNDGRFSLVPLLATVTGGNTLRILRFTLLQAFLSSLIALAMGLPGAWFIARTDFPGKRVVRSLSVVPFVLPPILVVLGFVTVFGNNGMINRLLMAMFSLEEPPLRILYSLKGILLAHGFYNFPVVLRIVSAFWEAIPTRQEHAARLMGAKGFYRFRTIIFPQLLPSILSSMLLVFLFCFSSFAIILVLGGGPKTTTIEVEIYRLARIAMDMRGAGRVALLASAVSILPLLLHTGGGARFTGIGSGDNDRRITQEGGLSRKVLGTVYAVVMLVLVVTPLLGVIINGFLEPAGPLGKLQGSLRWYRQIFFPGGSSHDIFTTISARAAAGTMLLASLTLLITIPAATLFALGTVRSSKRTAKFLDLAATLPMTISTVVLGAGYLLTSVRFPVLTGSPLFIAGAHSVIAFPFVYRSVLTVLKKIDGSYRQAAISLGAKPGRAFLDIEMPMLEPALFSAAAFAFALSVGEMNATLTLSGGTFSTLPITIYRLIGSYQFHGASALGTILIVLCGAAFILLDHSTKDSGGKRR